MSFLRLFDVSLLIDSDPLRQFLNRALRPAAIRASRRCLCITATDWRKGLLHFFWNRDMTDETATPAVMASSAIPGFFPPVNVGGNLYVDGGVLMNTPLKPAIQAGADVLHVIYLDPAVSAIPLAVLQSTMGTFDRMLVTQRAKMINTDLEAAVRINQGLHALEQLPLVGRKESAQRRELVRAGYSAQAEASADPPFRKVTIHRYHPREDLGGQAGSLNFDRERMRNLIGKGYFDAVNHDCVESECVMPDGQPIGRTGSGGAPSNSLANRARMKFDAKPVL